jgi:ribosomal protein S18 acetylase RimI-like enzyme
MNSSAATIDVIPHAEASAALPALVAILQDCVAQGASVGFMHANTTAEYEAYWRGVFDEVAAGRTVLLGASAGAEIVGTAQVQLVGKPNQPHRAEIAKVLVHSKARRQGLGEALMRKAETIARDAGRDLLVLDTDEAGAARRLYARLGWTEVGTIPRYALMPDGADCGSTFFYKDLR